MPPGTRRRGGQKPGLNLGEEDGEIRLARAKSSLRKSIGVTVNQRTSGKATAIIIDVSAFLWTIRWPSKGTLGCVLTEIKKTMKEMLK